MLGRAICRNGYLMPRAVQNRSFSIGTFNVVSCCPFLNTYLVYTFLADSYLQAWICVYDILRHEIQQSWQTSVVSMHLGMTHLVSMSVIFCLLPTHSMYGVVYQSGGNPDSNCEEYGIINGRKRKWTCSRLVVQTSQRGNERVKQQTWLVTVFHGGVNDKCSCNS